MPKTCSPISTKRPWKPARRLPRRISPGGVLIAAKGKNAHASTPAEGNNAITALLCALLKLPLVPCEGVEKLRALYALTPHGQTDGTNFGIAWRR